MRALMQLLERFGGRALAAALPSPTEFEHRLQEDSKFREQVAARIRAVEVDLDVQSRGRRISDKFHPQRLGGDSRRGDSHD